MLFIVGVCLFWFCWVESVLLGSCQYLSASFGESYVCFLVVKTGFYGRFLLFVYSVVKPIYRRRFELFVFCGVQMNLFRKTWPINHHMSSCIWI